MPNQIGKSWYGKSGIHVLTIFLSLTGLVFSVEAKTSSFDKLDSRLYSIAGVTDSSKLTLQSLSANASPLKNSLQPIFVGKKVRIEVRLRNSNPSAIAQLKSAGMQISSQHKSMISGTILPDQLKNLAKLDVVSTVYPYIPPMLQSIPGEGVEALRANLVQQGNPEFDGTGIKIGILSDSFGRVSEATPVVEDINGDGIDEIVGTDSQLSGDLPPVIELLKDGQGSADDYSDEGRGMAEIIHEMAPGADLAFYTAFNGSSDFANGIVALATAGCQVIVDDVTYFLEPFFQDGEIAQAVDTVANDYDVVYLSSAGNAGAHALEGMYSDIDPEWDDGGYSKIPLGYDLHQWNFGEMRVPTPYLRINLMPGSSIVAVLQWENPYSGDLGPGATCDYDLYALSEPDFRLDTIVSYSDNYQGEPDYPGGDPWEIIGITNDSDEVSTGYLAINYHHGEPAKFKLIFLRVDEDSIFSSIRTTDSNMIWGQTASANCMAVAAVNVIELLSGGQAQGNPNRIDPAFYSSLGGEFPILFSATGEYLSDPEIRFKPDITSVDGTNTSFFYNDSPSDEDDYPNFFGTSAAAPHAAAIAALMRQANPDLTAADIRDTMRSAATDIFTRGVDAYTGYGLLYADDAILAVNPSFVPADPNELPEPTPTPEFVETPTPTTTPGPTATPTPPMILPNPAIPLGSVIVTDNLYTEDDLTNGQDADSEDDRMLVIRWNITKANITDYHVYVSVDGQKAQYLGRTTTATADWFVWEPYQPSTNAIFNAGPQFGHTYTFSVYGITISGVPHFIGPFSTAGPVEFMERQ